jgi:hypothetical protein
MRLLDPQRTPKLLPNCMSGFAVSLATGCRCEKPAQGACRAEDQNARSAAIVEGHLIAVGVRERESAAERPVDGR